MPVIVKPPSGNWRAQVRRKGKYIGNTFRRRADADTWALETERTIDKGLNPKAINPHSVQTNGASSGCLRLCSPSFDHVASYRRILVTAGVRRRWLADTQVRFYRQERPERIYA